jgi:murein DD-endopeptidase MepM/ murein hydrolase activator NlpD
MSLPKEIEDQVRSNWSISDFIVSVREGYLCQHFIFRDPSHGSIFIKRFLNEQASERLLSSQTALAIHCSKFVTEGKGARCDLYFHTPRIIPTKNGKLFLANETKSEFLIAYQVVEGRVLHDWLELDGARQYSDIIGSCVGELVGRLDISCQGWKAPTTSRVLSRFETEAVMVDALSHDSFDDRISCWDPRHSLQHLEDIDVLPVGETRTLIERGYNLFKDRLLPLYNISEARDSNSIDEGCLRRSWIHGDAHDCNIIVRETETSKQEFKSTTISSLLSDNLTVIDWDDFSYSYLIHNPVISLTYLILWAFSNPDSTLDEKVKSAKAIGCSFFNGYCSAMPLFEAEIRSVVPLLIARLSTSLFMSTKSAAADGLDNDRVSYILLHQEGAKKMLKWLLDGGKELEDVLTNAWNEAAITASNKQKSNVSSYEGFVSLTAEQEMISKNVIKELVQLKNNDAFGFVVDIPIQSELKQPEVSSTPLGNVARECLWKSEKVGEVEGAWLRRPPFINDWSGQGSSGSTLISIVGSEPSRLAAFTKLLDAPLVSIDDKGNAQQYRLGWGKYMENRVIYQSDLFLSEIEPRSLHLGVDIGALANTPIRSPLDGFIHSWARNNSDLDYGPTIILKHILPSGGELFTLYGHLSLDSLFDEQGIKKITVGSPIRKGEIFARVGPKEVNGGWPPHLHFQLMTAKDNGNWRGDYPGVCSPSHREAYALLTPDPNIILQCPFIKKIGWE